MKKFLSEFKEFISRGDAMSMAIGIIIGGAFTAIVTSLVNDIITPILGIIIGGLDFTGITVSVGDSIMKAFNKLQRKKEEPAPEPEKPSEEVQLLTEIRDLLSEQREYNENR